jgi:guanine deaminase
MCLAAMYDCSPDRVVFITTREDDSRFSTDDRKDSTLASFYGEVCKPWQERAMPVVHLN